MKNSKGKTVLKIFCGIIAAAALVTAGYICGSHTQFDTIVSSLPHMKIDNIEPPQMSPERDVIPIIEPSDMPEKFDERIETGRTVVKSSQSAAQEDWSTVRKYSCDLTGDDSDTIRLYTSAEKEDGEFLWDDGQQWVAEIYDGDGGYYTLLDKYIQNGSVYFTVSELEDGKNAVTLFIQTGTGLEIKQYTYSRNGFTETELYNSGAVNSKYSSIPYYN